MAFGEFWNRRRTETQDYLFIICGSATSWIIKNVLDNTGSMYQRITCWIYLEPFCLRETEQFLHENEFGRARSQMMECHMIFGGLPFFFNLMNPNESLRQNVDRLMFRPRALLKGESNRLLETTLNQSPAYGKFSHTCRIAVMVFCGLNANRHYIWRMAHSAGRWTTSSSVAMSWNIKDCMTKGIQHIFSSLICFSCFNIIFFRKTTDWIAMRI